MNKGQRIVGHYSKFLGQVVQGWIVLGPCEETVMLQNGQRGYRLYLCECVGCGVQSTRSSRAIGCMSHQERTGLRLGLGCKECRRKRDKAMTKLWREEKRKAVAAARRALGARS